MFCFVFKLHYVLHFTSLSSCFAMKVAVLNVMGLPANSRDFQRCDESSGIVRIRIQFTNYS